MFPIRCLALAAFFWLLGVSLGGAADDAAAVKEKLNAAKHEYNLESEKYRKLITDQFEKQEDAARKAGDKKALAQVKADQKTFEKTGRPPALMPAAARQHFLMVRAKVNANYSEAVKAFIRLKLDDDADATDGAQREFLAASGILAGKSSYLVSLKHADAKVGWGTFTNNGTLTGTGPPFNFHAGPAPHSILMAPVESSFSTVSYTLGKKLACFHATVGIPKIEENTQNPATAVTFEVVGDGKSLWKSKPVGKVDEFQSCDVWLQGVKVLTLRVHCPGKIDWVRSVWFEPMLIEL
jgi:hypothetical protein